MDSINHQRKYKFKKIYTPADVRNNFIPSGFANKPCEQIFIVNASWIIGNGGATTLALFEQVLAEQGIKVAGRIAPFDSNPPWLSNCLVNQSPLVQLIKPDANSVNERFEAATNAFIEFFTKKSKTCKSTTFGFIGLGYTSYLTFGIKTALSVVNRNYNTDFKAVVINADDAFMDGFERNEVHNKFGYPISRFGGSGSDENVRSIQIAMSIFPEDINILCDSVADGVEAILSSKPYSKKFVKHLHSFRNINKVKAIQKLIKSNLSDDVKSKFSNPNIIKLLDTTHRSYWDLNAVGEWMTSSQFKDSLDGNKNFLLSAERMGQTQNKSVIIFGTSNLALLNTQIKTRKVLVIDKPILDQDVYPLLLKSVDIVVTRSSQESTHLESTLIGAPVIELTRPSKGYMYTDTLANYAYKSCVSLIPSELEVNYISHQFESVLKNPTKNNQFYYDLWKATHFDNSRNFGYIVKHLLVGHNALN